ncbi:translation initiation factor IF-5A [Candidatus Micrarchaeota archaeon]|nr:translation initiation factor IF-5A [Candidatus Micrarchaeota archaeon]
MIKIDYLLDSDYEVRVLEGEKNFAEAKELKVGKYILIDGVPCRVANIDSSSPGKHGHAKLAVTAVSLFTNSKKIISLPSNATVEIPVITRKTGQIISIEGDTVQVMDMQTYEISDMMLPEEFKSDAGEGKMAELMCAMGKCAIVKIVEG